MNGRRKGGMLGGRSPFSWRRRRLRAGQNSPGSLVDTSTGKGVAVAERIRGIRGADIVFVIPERVRRRSSPAWKVIIPAGPGGPSGRGLTRDDVDDSRWFDGAPRET